MMLREPARVDLISSIQSRKMAKARRISCQVSTQSCPDIICTVVTGEVQLTPGVRNAIML
jgi:hypothetical protein